MSSSILDYGVKESEEVVKRKNDKMLENSMRLYCENCQGGPCSNFEILTANNFKTFNCCCFKLKYSKTHNDGTYLYNTCCLVCKKLSIRNFGNSPPPYKMRICCHCGYNIQLYFKNKYFINNSDVHDYARQINYQL